MLDGLIGENVGQLGIAVAAVAVGLLGLVIVLRFIRNRPSSPFIRGGKNRQPRLAVLDAAAVDTRRRLVLVRRDNVEHLIMIGGPTDIVIESRIQGAALPEEIPVPARQQVAQPSVETRVQQPAVARSEARAEARAETRPELKTEPRTEPRPDPKQDSRAPSVSAVGQALYGESFDTPAQVTRPQAAPVARATPVAVQTPQRVQPVAAQPSRTVPAAATPEDILDAARNRVLAVGPATASQPAATPAIQPTGGQRSEFESVLDAELSGDLKRLRPEPLATVVRPEQRQSVTNRPPERKEPTIEEEMNRMLAELAAEPKP